MLADIVEHLLTAAGHGFFQLLWFFFFFSFIAGRKEDIHGVWNFIGHALLFRPQDLQNTLIRFFFSFSFIALAFLFLNHADGIGHEVAYDLFYVTAYIAYFRIFRRFDFDKRRADQTGQAAGDFCLAYAGRSDEQDILGDDFILHIFTQPFTAPAVAQGNGYRFLGFALADDVFIQFSNNLLWR